MQRRIDWNIRHGVFAPCDKLAHVTAFQNLQGGWVDYMVGEKLVFSHRVTDFTGFQFTGKLHAHRYFELVLCDGGEGMQYIANRCHLTVGQGAAIVTAPSALHLYRPQSQTRYDRYVVLFARDLVMTPFDGGGVLSFLNRVGQSEENTSLCLQLVDEQQRKVFRLAARAERQLREDTPYSTAAAWLTLSELFLALSIAAEQPGSRRAIPAEAPDFICAIKQYIDEEYVSIHSVADLTERFFYSREYITRVFKQYYNTPIYEYIINRKLLHNRTLLREGVSVEQAAALSGFHNMSSYIKQFKRFTGCTPSVYRSQQNEGD